MPLPDQTPKLPKLPFLVGDAALLAAAWFIANQAAHPWQPEAIFAIAGCVFGGAVVGAIPFLTDYARRQDEALDERQRGLEALARTVATSAEQISIAAQGLHEIVEPAQKNLKQAEQLPHKLQEKIAGLQSRVSGDRDQEKEELERELAALRASEADRIESAAAQPYLSEPIDTEAAASGGPSPYDPQTAAPPAPVAKAPRKPRGPRKPKIEAAPPPALETSDAQVELPVFSTAAPSEFSQIAPDEAAPATAVSTDGATRLLVTAYIGIGNRLFIRGDGPGLSWEKGVPLQFVSIGKWRWEAADAAAPIRFKLYKNDELECAALGERSLEAGRQQDVTASF